MTWRCCSPPLPQCRSPPRPRHHPPWPQAHATPAEPSRHPALLDTPPPSNQPAPPWPQHRCEPTTVFLVLSSSHPTDQQGQQWWREGKNPKRQFHRPGQPTHRPSQTGEQNMCGSAKLDLREKSAMRTSLPSRWRDRHGESRQALGLGGDTRNLVLTEGLKSIK